MPSGVPLHVNLEAYKRLGERIKQCRLDAGISQTQLATITGVGKEVSCR